MRNGRSWHRVRVSDDMVTDERRETGTRDRSAFTWSVGAVVLLVIIGVLVFALLDGDGEDRTVPGSAGPSETPQQSVTRLTVSEPVGRCMVPNVRTLARQELAFDGVVESVTEGEATLTAREFYAGEPTDLVTVRGTDRELPVLLGRIDLQEGDRYLIAATDGEVVLCGFSDSWSRELADLYERAFAG